MKKTIKNTISVIVSIVLILGLVPNIGEVNEVHAAATAVDIISIANGEVGYTSSSLNANKYCQWFGTYDDWCAIFISWCANKAEIPENIIKKNASADLRSNVVQQGRFGSTYYPKGSISPQPGDIVYFDWDGVNGSNHVEIVTEIRTDTIVSVGGNVGKSPGSVKPRETRKNSDLIYGYERPNYSDDSTPPLISNITAKMTSSDSYTVECDVTDNVGVTSVKFPTWPGYRDCRPEEWREPTSVNGNHYTFTFNTAEYNYYKGKYYTHIYAYDAANNYTGVDGNAPTFIPNLSGTAVLGDHRYELYTTNCRWSDAKKSAETMGDTLLLLLQKKKTM